MPEVPLASSGRIGLLTHTSTPWTKGARQRDVVVLDEEDLADELARARDRHDLLEDLLPVAVVGVRLAGEDDAHRALLVGQDVREPRQVAQEQLGALVGRETPREAHPQRVLLEAVEHAVQHGRAVVALEEARLEAALHRVEHAPLAVLLDAPQLLRLDLGRLGEVGRLDRAAADAQAPAQVRIDPGREVHAVRDRVDRHFALEQLGPERVQQALAHAPVQLAHAVHEAREVERQVGHVERPAVLLGLAQRVEALPRHAGPAGRVGEVAPHQLLGEAVVAGRHGRVRREHGRGTHDLARLLEGQAELAHEPAHALEHQEGGVTLVDVEGRRPDAQTRQEALAAAPEHDLLPQAQLGVAAVELARDVAVLGPVDLDVRVEQIEVDAPDLHLPGAQHQVRAGQLQRDLERPALLVEHQLERQVARVVLGLGVDLLAGGGHALAHVAHAVEQAHRDQRQRQVAGRLEVVAGQDAQAAAVDAQRLVQAELGAEVGHRVLARERDAATQLVGHVLARHVGLEARQDASQALDVLGALRARAQVLGVDVAQVARDVAAVRLPLAREDLAEELGRLGIPRPPIVARQPLEARQRGRQRGRDLEAHQVRTARLRSGRDRHASFGSVGHARATARRGRGQRAREGRFVLHDQARPGRALRRAPAGGDHVGALALLAQHDLEQVGQRDQRRLVGRAHARQHVHAVLPLEPGLARPAAEAGPVGGDGRDADRQALLGRVAPGLVEGREARQVHGAQHGLVGQVEHAVARAQVDRHLDHLDARALHVGEAQPAAALLDRIVLGVEQVVRRHAAGAPDRSVDALERLLLALDHLAPQARVAGRHEREQHHAPPGLALQARQRLEQEVDALVVELVAPRDAHEARVGDVLSEHTMGQVAQPVFRFGARGRPGDLVDHVQVDAVGQQRLGLAPEEQLGLVAGHLADRGEHVGRARARGLDRVLRAHVLRLRGLLGVAPGQTLLGRQPAGSEGAPEHGGVGREHRADLGHALLQVQHARAGHPLVELRHRRAARAGAVLLPPGLDHDRGRVAEHHRLEVVPAAEERVDFELLPEPGEDLVLLGEQA
jgi:hypothetical protein